MSNKGYSTADICELCQGTPAMCEFCNINDVLFDEEINNSCEDVTICDTSELN